MGELMSLIEKQDMQIVFLNARSKIGCDKKMQQNLVIGQAKQPSNKKKNRKHS